MTSLDAFRELVRQEGTRRYRDLPWRNTRDPYSIWISEVMLQQTQVSRVLTRWEAWLNRFPTVSDLAQAPVSEVLAEWQGMGYNRRALALKAAAERVVQDHAGKLPQTAHQLVALPGIGPATAQGIRSFAFDLPGVYLETNVRAVFLHHFFPDIEAVADRELSELVAACCPPSAGEVPSKRQAVPQDVSDTPRSWYYALLDYGAYLKKVIPNPSRRSASYTRQSRFEGSRRQKRACLVRFLLDAAHTGIDEQRLVDMLNEQERAAGREPVDAELVASILGDLLQEGFCVKHHHCWMIAQ